MLDNLLRNWVVQMLDKKLGLQILDNLLRN